MIEKKSVIYSPNVDDFFSPSGYKYVLFYADNYADPDRIDIKHPKCSVT